MSFHVGQKVVCVDNANMKKTLVVGAIYVVDGVYERNSTIYVTIAGKFLNFRVRGIFPSRFRPIVEKKTDISIFTAMLNPKKARERA